MGLGNPRTRLPNPICLLTTLPELISITTGRNSPSEHMEHGRHWKSMAEYVTLNVSLCVCV